MPRFRGPRATDGPLLVGWPRPLRRGSVSGQVWQFHCGCRRLGSARPRSVALGDDLSTRPTAAPDASIGVRRLEGAAVITGHAEVKAAAKAWEVFSSDLLGDRDVRTYRQLPLEVDPPVHRAYRGSAHAGLRAGAGRGPRARAARRRPVPRRPPGPRQARSRRSTSSPCRWSPRRSASPSGVGRTSTSTAAGVSRRGRRCPTGGVTGRTWMRISERVFDEAFAAIRARTCSVLWREGTIDGHPLSRTQMLGVGNLILAGGRDTVINLISGAIWHLGSHPDDRSAAGWRSCPDPGGDRGAHPLPQPLARMERVMARDASGRLGFGRRR